MTKLQSILSSQVRGFLKTAPECTVVRINTCRYSAREVCEKLRHYLPEFSVELISDIPDAVSIRALAMSDLEYLAKGSGWSLID